MDYNDQNDNMLIVLDRNVTCFSGSSDTKRLCMPNHTCEVQQLPILKHCISLI